MWRGLLQDTGGGTLIRGSSFKRLTSWVAFLLFEFTHGFMVSLQGDLVYMSLRGTKCRSNLGERMDFV